MNRDPTRWSVSETGYSYRPDRVRLHRGNERSIATSVFNRIAMDVAAVLYSFSLSMEADTLKWRVQKGEVKAKPAYAEMERTIKAFCARKDVPDAMKRHFMQCADEDLLTFLTNCSRAYLR